MSGRGQILEDFVPYEEKLYFLVRGVRGVRKPSTFFKWEKNVTGIGFESQIVTVRRMD